MLEDLYGLVYGERPVGVRAWCDGSALLMVVRLAGPLESEQAELAAMVPCEGIPELVVAAVRAQTGWALAVGSWSVEADLGLVMFVFRLPGRPAGARARSRAGRRRADDERRARVAARGPLAGGAHPVVARLEPACRGVAGGGPPGRTATAADRR